MYMGFTFRLPWQYSERAKKPPATAPRCVIYTRVSLDRTGEGASNDRQEEACRLTAQARGWTVVDVLSDISKSAYDRGVIRPAWEQAQEMMRRGECDVVLAWKMDRITRTVSGFVDIAQLCEETGAGIATVDGQMDLSTAQGKAVATILAAVAQMEIELKGERQALANEQRRNAGEPWPSGFRMFGYAMGGELIPEEAGLIRSGAQTFLRGESLAAIARAWTTSGVLPVKGGQWRNTTVRTLLQNARLAGFQTHGREIVPGVHGNWEPILSEEEFTLIQLRLGEAGRGDRHGPKGPLPSHLLSGIATCAKCGENVRGQGNDASGRPCYSCPNRCVMATRQEMDGALTQGFALAATLLPGLALTLDRRKAAQGNTHEVLAEIARLREELETLGEEWAESSDADRTFIRAASRKTEERIAALEDSLVGPGAPESLADLNAEAVRNFLRLDTQGKRSVLSRLARVVLHPKGRGKKNVPSLEQITLDVRIVEGDREGWAPVLRPIERDTVERDLFLTVDWADGVSHSLHCLGELLPVLMGPQDEAWGEFAIRVVRPPEFE